MICLRRRNKVHRPAAIEAAFFVDLPELLLKFRDLIPDAPWKPLVPGPRRRRRLTQHRDRADAADRPGRAGADGAAQRAGLVEMGTQATIWGREPDKFSLHCRRTATASLFLGRNRTSDSTRIPVWISLLKPGSVDRSLPGCPQDANACGISCATVGLCSEAQGRGLEWQKYSDAMV
jgi:hypothetical protein